MAGSSATGLTTVTRGGSCKFRGVDLPARDVYYIALTCSKALVQLVNDPQGADTLLLLKHIGVESQNVIVLS